MKDLFTGGIREAGSNLGGKITAEDAQEGTDKGAAQHFQALPANLGDRTALGFDEHGQAAHVIGKL